MSLIDFNNKIIFIHIPRTAGTSIESALGSDPPTSHLTIKEIADFISKDTIGVNLDEFFKFSFVRNPLDRLVSIYANLVIKQDDMTQFNNWIVNHYDARPFRLASDFLCDENGNMKMDFVGKFENLEADWQKACERIGKKLELPHIDFSTLQLRKPYQDYYTTGTKTLIRDWMKADFIKFGYN